MTKNQGREKAGFLKGRIHNDPGTGVIGSGFLINCEQNIQETG